MKSPLPSPILFLLAVQSAFAIQAPTGLVSRTGDLSIVLHWDRNSEADLGGYRVYRSTNSIGPFALQTPSPVVAPGFCDLLNLKNGQPYYYQVTAVTTTSQESPPSAILAATPHVFASDDEFLEYVQQTSFDFFLVWSEPGERPGP